MSEIDRDNAHLMQTSSTRERRIVKWTGLKQAALDRLILFCLTAMDGGFILLLFVLLILLDKAKDWIFENTGTANFLTRATVGTVEVLLDAGLVAAVGGWVYKDIRCTFGGHCDESEI